MQLIGTPDEADLGYVNENARIYIRQLPRHARQSFTEKFPHVHPAAIDLVEKMLTFDPRQRITGEHILPSCTYNLPLPCHLSFCRHLDTVMTIYLNMFLCACIVHTHVHPYACLHTFLCVHHCVCACVRICFYLLCVPACICVSTCTCFCLYDYLYICLCFCFYWCMYT